jgi:hypothetical protein
MIFGLIFAAELLDLEMSPQDKKQTGIYKLSSKQKSALQHWIDEHYLKREETLSLAKKDKKPKVSRIDLKEGSTFLHLTDGTLWKIRPSDAKIALSWINPDAEVLIQENGKLTNSISGTTVHGERYEPSIHR